MNEINEPFGEFLEEIRKTLAPYAEAQSKIQEALLPFAKAQSKLRETIAPFDGFRKSFEPLIARAKEIEQEHGSVSNYLNKLIEERHQVLAEYGWFYAFGISDQLADKVFNRRNSLTQSIVDKMVTDFFKDDNFAELTLIVAKWKQSPHFTSRLHIFDEAVASHIQERFYSSVTLLSVHTEGIISDYIRYEKNARYNFEKCIKDLEQLLSDQSNTAYFPQIERKVLFDFLTDVCISSFWYENPDLQDPQKTNGMQVESHNLSRHKLAHGHVVSGLSETDSLKCFLYLNALFHLFFELNREDG